MFAARTVTELATLAGAERVEYVASAAGVESGALAFLDTVERRVGEVYAARRAAHPEELDLDSALAALADAVEVDAALREAVPTDDRDVLFVVGALAPGAALAEFRLGDTRVEADRRALRSLGLRLARALLAAHVGVPASRTYEVTYSVEVPFDVADVDAAARTLLARREASYVGHTPVDED